ncbi:hypothetical protein, partial [Staphylococcus coagulans]
VIHISLKAQLMAGLRLRFFKLCATLHIFAGAGRRNQIDFCPAPFMIKFNYNSISKECSE